MKKAISLLLVLLMVVSLAAIGGTAMAKGPVKIGVLVADVSGEEALGFRNYYENYIAANYDVTFTYTEQLADAAAEKSAIEKFAAQGYDAILSLSSSDRVTQLETCAEYEMYYAVASGMLDDAQYEQFKTNEYFVGQIGPSMDTEFEAGYAMGKYFADKGVKTIGLYGAFIPNPMHVYRAAGVIAGIGATYGGASEKDAIVGQIFGDMTVDLSKVEGGDVKIVGYFQGFGDTTFDELFGIIGQGPEAFLSVGMATTFFTDALNNAGVEFSDIDSFTTGNAAAMADGKLVYLAGKYSSSVGPIFAAVLNEKLTSRERTLVTYGRDTFMRRASSVCDTPSRFIRSRMRRRNAEPILSIAVNGICRVVSFNAEAQRRRVRREFYGCLRQS